MRTNRTWLQAVLAGLLLEVCFSAPTDGSVRITAALPDSSRRAPTPHRGPIHWFFSPIPSAASFHKSQILRDGLGFALANDGVLWKYANAAWQPIPNRGIFKVERFYALAENDIWASGKVPGIYRELLFHYDGSQWRQMPSPNLYNIRTIYFRAPDDGWIGCEYGELWHYDGKNWRREKIPTQIHITELQSRANGDLLAFAEGPFQAVYLLRDRAGWRQLMRGDGDYGMALSPGDVLFILQCASPRYSEVPPFRVYHTTYRSMDFFPDSSGYALHRDSLFYFDGTGKYFVQDQMLAATDLRLHSRRFSWIIGHRGFCMMPSQFARQDTALPTLPVASPHTLGYQKISGIGVIRELPSIPQYLMMVVSAESNVAFDFEKYREANLPSGDLNQAALLNLEGSLFYPPSDTVNATESPTAFDQGIAVGDLNNDGLEDIVICSLYGHPEVHLNSGHAYFFEATSYAGLLHYGSPRVRHTQPALNDVDHDGDLDLFMTAQFSSNSLFLNDGFGRFTETTEVAGLQSSGGSIVALFVDVDNDGWDDLYVANTNGRNFLYKNSGVDAATGLPVFQDAADHGGDACWEKLEETSALAAGDYDNDGDFDLIVFTGVDDVRLLVNDGAGNFRALLQPFRLPHGALVKAATFLDFNNDGYLDLLVVTRGRNAMYWGSARGDFQREPQNNLLNLQEYHPMNYQNPAGKLSTTVVQVDADSDGDLDVFIGNYDTDSFFVRNSLHAPATSIQIFPEGIRSNRSAIGAKIFLFDNGHADEPGHLRGVRAIQVGANGSSDEKIAHFGVIAGRKYCAHIVFPSGVVRHLDNLHGGMRVVVRERDGAGAMVQAQLLRTSNAFWGYRRDARLKQVFILILLLIAGGLFGRYRLIWSRKLITFFVVVELITFVVTGFFLFYTNTTLFFGVPLAACAVAGLSIAGADRFRHLLRGRGASFEALQNRLSAFGHGGPANNIINATLFCLKNLGIETTLSSMQATSSGQKEGSHILSAEHRERLKENVNEMLTVVGAEVQAILTYLRTTRFSTDIAVRIRGEWKPLRARLERLSRGFSDERLLPVNFLTALIVGITRLKRELHVLQLRLEEYFCCYPQDVLQTTIRRYQKQGRPVVLEMPQETLPRVRFQPEELHYLIDELITNALAATHDNSAEIAVRCGRRLGEVFIDVCDNGHGIERSLWDEIFNAAYSTKKDGGFGLYHARRTASKYGGRIFVQQSEVGRGTIIRLILQTIRPKDLQTEGKE